MTKLSLRDLDVRGKRVLVRADFNVPTETRGGKIRITDDTRIRETLPTTNYLRAHEANDPDFTKALASLADLYVNDAFGAAHRAHASTVGITKFVEKSAMGFLMEKELKHLGDGLDKPAKPFVVILGGAKVSDKIGVL